MVGATHGPATGPTLIYANVLLGKDPSWFVHDSVADGVLERLSPVTMQPSDAGLPKSVAED